MAPVSDSLSQLFATPFCPHCATLFDAEQWDDVDECARCSHCGTAYQIPDAQRPTEPVRAGEIHPTGTPSSPALDQFRADAKRLADNIGRETAGASYELFAQRFTEACASPIDDLDPTVRTDALTIANDHGYIEDADAADAGFGPGRCPVSGIEVDYCHCGRHP